MLQCGAWRKRVVLCNAFEKTLCMGVGRRASCVCKGQAAVSLGFMQLCGSKQGGIRAF